MRIGVLQEPVRGLLAAQGILAALVALALALVWRAVPPEGVKLHGTIDTGVDLLGSRRDLLWIFTLAVGILGGNAWLASWIRRREPVAALFLLSSTVPLLCGLLGALLFIFLLNRPR